MGTELDLEKNKSSQKEFQTLLNKDFENRKLKENSIIKATVTEITKNFVVVDCKAKMEGMIPVEEFKNDEEFKKWVVAKWSIAPERKMKNYGHPAMFPEELVRRGLKLFSFENDLILDPFNGVGTTTKVAHELNRN